MTRFLVAKDYAIINILQKRYATFTTGLANSRKQHGGQ